MNLYTKWLFAPWGGAFPLPWTMLTVQQIQAFCILQPWIAVHDFFSAQDKGEATSERLGGSDAVQVLVVTCLFCLNVGLNSLSLVRISVTLNQTVRAFLPVGVLLLGTCLERRAYPWHAYATTLPLVAGIALTCWGNPDLDPCGLCCVLGSTLIGAAGSSLNGRLLRAGPRGRAGPTRIVRLMALQSVPAAGIFGLMAALTEGPQLRSTMEVAGPQQWHRIFGLLTVSSAIALLANLGRCGLVAATSALMETVAGNAKVAALCIVDNLFFGTVLSGLNYAGVAVTFVSFSAHLLLQYASSAGAPFEDLEIDEVPTERAPGDGEPPARSLSRSISAAETGLAAEHLALWLREQPRRCCWGPRSGPEPEELLFSSPWCLAATPQPRGESEDWLLLSARAASPDRLRALSAVSGTPVASCDDEALCDEEMALLRQQSRAVAFGGG